MIDDAARRIRENDGLSHDAQKALEEDVRRADSFLRDFSPKGAHGLALFACGPEDLFEAIRLPRPIDTRVVIDDTPTFTRSTFSVGVLYCVKPLTDAKPNVGTVPASWPNAGTSSPGVAFGSGAGASPVFSRLSAGPGAVSSRNLSAK